MKSDLSNVKVGDTIWTIQDEYTKVIAVNNPATYPIETATHSYALDGKFRMSDKFPSAFLTNPFEREEWEERVMEVSDDQKSWIKRVVFTKCKNGYAAYDRAQSIEATVHSVGACIWEHAREIEVQPEPESVEMTIAEIEQALGKKIKIKG